MTVRGGGVRKNHGFHAVVQNGSAASELSLPMRKTASWSGVIAAPPNTRLRHECSCATSELPSTRPSRPQRASCRARVCQGMAWHRREHEEISERRPTLTNPARDSVWTLWVGAKKWGFKSNKEIELKEKIACCEFSA